MSRSSRWTRCRSTGAWTSARPSRRSRSGTGWPTTSSTWPIRPRTTPWSASSTQARAAIADVEARGRRALLVGGTGLYLQAVIDDLTFPGEDRELRAALDRARERPGGLAAMYTELRVRDPVAAARIEPGNRRRIVRALEVIELTGTPVLQLRCRDRRRPRAGGPGPAGGPRGRHRGALGAASRRAWRPWPRAGLLDEVLALADPTVVADGPPGDRVQGGPGAPRRRLATFADACVAIARRSRTFARRQRAWFRRDGRIRWFDATAKSTSTAAEVMAWWAARMTVSAQAPRHRQRLPRHHRTAHRCRRRRALRPVDRCRRRRPDRARAPGSTAPMRR